jgi:two-component system phosphate regulon sensor histidine kinase PhoR
MRPAARRFYLSLLALIAAVLVVAGYIIDRRAPGPAFGLWLFLVAIFVAFAAAAYPLVAGFGRRLRALEEAALALATGDLTARAPVEAHDDLAGMARAINETAEREERERRDLTRQRDEAAAALNFLPQGVALLTRELGIRHANSRFWQAVGVEAPTRSPTLATARQPVLLEVCEEAVRSGRAVTREVALYADGRREVVVSALPVPEAGRAEGWLLTIEDLGPERRAAEIRREFVANASHELKTPLTSIRGYAETLLHGGLADEANRDRFVETIRAQAERLEELVDDLLSLADLERPDAALDLKDWDLGGIVRELAASFDDLASRRSLTLDVDAPSGAWVRCDRKRLELALRNLVDNAIKYTETGGVRVKVTLQGAAARVEVTDSGRGIPAEHLSRIFERFYRVEQGRSRALGGTGLGLSIVKHAVALHGGTVGVVSRPGEGSTFWLEVPRGGPDGAAPDGVSAPGASPAGGPPTGPSS